MVPTGPPNPIGGSQSVPSSLLRSNSGVMGGQGGSMPSPGGFPSMVSPRTMFGNMNMLGNAPNVSHQSFANGGPNAGLAGPGSSQRGPVDNGAETDPLSGVGNGMGFSAPSTSFMSSAMVTNPDSSRVQGQQFPNPSGNHMLTDQQRSQQLDSQNFQHNQQLQQFSSPINSQTQQQQHQFQSMRGGLGSLAPVKMETQVTNDQTPQQLQALRNLAPVKMEPQQIQSMRGLAPVKVEQQQSDPSLFLHQQQQQQQFLQMSRQSPQAAAAAQLLHQQRLMQFQHHHQLLKTAPQQRNPLQQQFQSQNLAVRPPVKPVYEPGMCARRLTHYMYQQQHRPEDNNIEFWRKFVAEYFAPNAKKKWCVSMYGSGRQTTGVFPQDVWHCEICSRKPGRGFEATAEVLPRLFKIKYESGTLEELLYIDMPREYQNSSGQIVLDYAKAIQESVFEQLRVVRDGQLRLVFSQPDLKIVSWEFCARRHEELIPRRLLIPQVSQLGAAAQKYQAATQNASSSASVSELQNNCNMFVASARQLAKALEVPLVNDLGYTKRYVRCLQISEVVNSMKDLIDYSRETGTGPMESLAKFPRRNGASAGVQGPVQSTEDQTQQPQQQQHQQQQQQHPQQQQQQQQHTHQTVSSSNHETTSQPGVPPLPLSNGMSNVHNSVNRVPATSSSGTVVGLLHQNSMNSRQQNPMNGGSSTYSGNTVQMPSPNSSSTMPQSQPNSSQFQSPTPSSSNNTPQASHSGLSSVQHMNSANSPKISMQQPAHSNDVDAHDSQSSVQKIIHEMMMSSQLGGGGMVGNGTIGNDIKNGHGMLATSNNSLLNGSNCLVRNGTANANSTGVGAGFGSMNNGLGQAAMVNGMRAALGNIPSSMNGLGGMTMARERNMSQQQQDLGNQLLSGLEAVNGFNNLQFDWKTSP
ncbi:transcriptional corepressor SEUSS isoform X32 [Solanum stenotomum]|uniref:transcriptional corepressor SEUSS isoform X15 n=1 Tax=Solanum stenotomum TaxID=172797 RepID=UPI0020D0BC07|nr:transcriptional corepressor SEUSS isoform X15 [Solanum stenotomum]XP_049411514.1 transcriptional corepressor SEUSS isoform X22 [Solanum stenotomum]XP_049411523.1 transcriptional corepressor SEUSS isoform X30 [Solanum stenotomum]XP_049411525.1 transcriptional corepressor SEUSS isoform X32 [Solanum stenotomum]